MSVTSAELVLLAGSRLAIYLGPGPVMLATAARGMSGGFRAAAPLVLGAGAGEVGLCLAVLCGSVWLSQLEVAGLRHVSAALFVLIGVRTILTSGRVREALAPVSTLANFLSGMAAIIASPTVLLFYLAALPGQLDLGRTTLADEVAVCALVLIPVTGNLGLAVVASKGRAWLIVPHRRVWMTGASGGLIAAIGLGMMFPLV